MVFLNSPSEQRYQMLEHHQHWFEKLWENENEIIFKKLQKREFPLKVKAFQIAENLVLNDIEPGNTFMAKYNSC